MDKALKGVRVLSVTQSLTGPFCGMLLADMGAEEIKIERPGIGDQTRYWVPSVGEERIGSYYLAVNRNKKGITLNLKTEKGVKLFKELVKVSDIILENNRPGSMELLGLGYEEMKKVNSGIIYTSISGFGQSGPYAQEASYDIVAQAMSGLMSVTGYPDRPPVRAGVSVGDYLAALFAAYGTLVALYYRERTGRGQRVDASLVEALISCQENFITNYSLLKIVTKRIGNKIWTIAPFNCYETKDGYLVIAVGTDALWARLAEAMGREDLITASDFSTNRKRMENVEKLDAIVEEWTKGKTSEEVISLLWKAKVPCGPVYTVDKVFEDPHFIAREMIVETNYPGVGTFHVTGVTPKLSLTPGSVETGPSTLGQHNEEIYMGLLGHPREEFLRWREEGII